MCLYNIQVASPTKSTLLSCFVVAMAFCVSKENVWASSIFVKQGFITKATLLFVIFFIFSFINLNKSLIFLKKNLTFHDVKKTLHNNTMDIFFKDFARLTRAVAGHRSSPDLCFATKSINIDP